LAVNHAFDSLGALGGSIVVLLSWRLGVMAVNHAFDSLGALGGSNIVLLSWRHGVSAVNPVLDSLGVSAVQLLFCFPGALASWRLDLFLILLASLAVQASGCIVTAQRESS
jgi:hypothetical protein